MTKTVALLYGFSEGHWHGKKFTSALLAAGYSVTENIEHADIVISHSAGCYYVPQLKDNQHLILIDPTYWPGKSRLTRALDLIRDYTLHTLPTKEGPYLIVKTFWNLYYLVAQFPRSKDIIRRSRHYNLQESIRHHYTILIRNSRDPWIRPNLENLQEKYSNLKIHHVPGDHDDCWRNPTPYIDLLQSEI